MSASNFDDLSLDSKRLEDGSGSNRAFTFLFVVVFLTCFGLVMLYSTSYDLALSHGLAHYYYFVHQLVYVLLALVAGTIVCLLPEDFLRKLGVPMILLALLLMLLSLFSPLGKTTMGARRWLRIGPLSLQPSEFVKVAMLFFMAEWFSRSHGKVIRAAVPLCITMLFATLILMQKDFSTTVVFIGLSLVVQLAAGLSLPVLVLVLAFALVPACLAIGLAPYRIARVASFLFPEADQLGAGYQVANSLKAIQAGGLFGVGIGQGVYKLGLLPEAQNDFIFASMCEELGLIWMLFLLSMYFVYALLGYRTFRQVVGKNPFFGYLAFGITTFVVSQALINIAVVLGVVPPTGLPLPFFSQGGTNLFMTLVSSALLFKIMLVSGGKSLKPKTKRPTFTMTEGEP